VQDLVLIVCFFKKIYNWEFCFVIFSCLLFIGYSQSHDSVHQFQWFTWFEFSLFLKKSFCEIFFFFHFHNLMLTYWALSFVICPIFLFVWVISVSYLGLQVNRVNMCWLVFFLKLIFYWVLSYAIKLLTLRCCYFFHLPLCGVISGANV
jgi:hypothetical protein